MGNPRPQDKTPWGGTWDFHSPPALPASFLAVSRLTCHGDLGAPFLSANWPPRAPLSRLRSNDVSSRGPSRGLLQDHVSVSQSAFSRNKSPGIYYWGKKNGSCAYEAREVPSPEDWIDRLHPKRACVSGLVQKQDEYWCPSLKVITQKELSPPQGRGRLFVLCRPSVSLMVSTSRMGSIPHREGKLINSTGSYTHRIQNPPE